MSTSPYLDAVIADLSSVKTTTQMQEISAKLLESFQEKLFNSGQCMLPSFIYRHPTGRETGHALALDLGGSTLRVAVIHISSSVAKILHRKDWVVSDLEKQMPATQFFDWMAANIKTLLESVPEEERPPVIGVSWSFPIM
jgi:hexokinase